MATDDPTPVMRAGDTDREVVAEILRTALGEGRLDLHEVDERLTRTYAARIYAELEPIVADLPGSERCPGGPRPRPRRRRVTSARSP